MTIESDTHFGPELNERINQLENIYSSTMLERVELLFGMLKVRRGGTHSDNGYYSLTGATLR